MTSDLNRRICAQLVLQTTFPNAELERLDRKRRQMEAQGGKLTPEQEREDALDRKLNEDMARSAIRTLEETKP